MLNVIAPGAVSSAANPVLDFWTQASVVDGDFTYYAPALPYALTFQIFDVRNPDAPAQVFPSTPGVKQAVDFTAHKIDGIVGHYAAAWTCSVDAAHKGRYQIRWFYTPTSTAAERMIARDFDVLPAAAAVPEAGTGYVLPSDMRDEGFVPSMASDAHLIKRIVYVSRLVERLTGRSFAPTYKTIQVRAGDTSALDLGEAVIALARLTIDGDDLPSDAFRVSNRHLSSGMIDPDDRESPMIDLRTTAGASSIVPLGNVPQFTWGLTSVGGPFSFSSYRNRIVTIRGLFGYTEYDGSPTGRTPLVIQQATKLLVSRELAKIASDERSDAKQRARLTGERTRDQSYTLAEPRVGELTGDAEIDDLLRMFMRGIRIGSA